MKKIGFIDWYLDEWHANNYPDWIRSNIAMKHRDCELAYAWADIDREGGVDTASWCAAHGVTRLSSLEELVEKSDYLILLSPDNPEHHERLAQTALQSGKPVYIDKPFSPDLQSSIRMFELAEKHGTPMFSSSALRFAEELAEYPNSQVNKDTLAFVATTGPGAYKEYAVHQFEMIVSLMGTGARRIKSLSAYDGRLLVTDYADGRKASMLQMGAAPFQANLQLRDGEGVFVGETTAIFERMIDAILDFFESGVPPVPKAETLEIMALIEAGRKALAGNDCWVEVASSTHLQ